MTPEVKRAAVFGGSFNPVHTGHMALARAVLERGLADEVWFVPCRRNPLKEEMPLFSDRDRLEMLRLAISEQPSGLRERMHACDIEYRLPEPSYTARTLEELHRLHPATALRLLIGADSLATFSRWRDPERIAALAPLIVYPRPGEEVAAEALPPGTDVLRDVPLSPVSATGIRRLLAEGGDTGGMLNKTVEKFILQK